MSETTKDQSVETLRTIALILLIGLHASEDFYPKIYEYILYSLDYLRVNAKKVVMMKKENI